MEIIPNTIKLIENNENLLENKYLTGEIITKILKSVVTQKISSRTLKLATEYLKLRNN